MSYLPNPTVTVGGVDFTADAVDSVNVTRGRNSVYSPATAGFASVSLFSSGTAVPKVSDSLEVFVSSGVVPDASGGDEVLTDVLTSDGVYQVHKFTSVGTSTFTLNSPAVVDVLVVAGGGAGFNSGGGGGGLAFETRALAAGTYSVVVGDGGVFDQGTARFDGEDSAFDDVVVPGGGGGVDISDPNFGADGGSGGGGVLGVGGSGVSPFGQDGGEGFVDTRILNRGGGGGFFEKGFDASAAAGGNGGGGFVSDFDGVTRDYSSGGGGGTSFSVVAPPVPTIVVGPRPSGGGPSAGAGGFRFEVFVELSPSIFESAGARRLAPDPGQVNTGGGGGAGGFAGVGFAAGGSGIVIVRIPVKQKVFSGSVSDVSASPVRVDGGLLFSFRLTAVGPLARLTRRSILPAGRPSELDGVRVDAAVGEAFALTWDEFTGERWEEIDSSVTWLSLSSAFRRDLIERGPFLLAALDAQDGGHVASAVANEAAESGRGVLFETVSGLVGYNSFTGRQVEAERLPLTFSFDDVSVNTFTAAVAIGDVVNAAEVEFSSGVVSRDNTSAIREFGRFSRRFNTVLAEEDDAIQFAEDIVESEGVPVFRLQSLDLNLRGVSDGFLRHVLASVPLNRLVRIEDLPSELFASDFVGFVEGVELSASRFEASVRLLLSDRDYSLGPVS